MFKKTAKAIASALAILLTLTGCQKTEPANTVHVKLLPVNTTIKYYGNYTKTGTQLWQIVLADNIGYINVEFFTPLDATTPVGTYSVTQSGSSAAGSAIAGSMDDSGNLSGSFYVDMTYYNYAIFATSGTVKISKQGEEYTIIVDLKDGEGNTIYSESKGKFEFSDGRLSNLTADVTVQNINAAQASSEGDAYGKGNKVWIVELSNASDEKVSLEVITDALALTPEGSFTIDNSYACEEGTAAGISPFFDKTYRNGKTGAYACADSGTISITQADNVYTVTADLCDENGFNISLNYTGEVKIIKSR